MNQPNPAAYETIIHPDHIWFILGVRIDLTPEVYDYQLPQ